MALFQAKQLKPRNDRIVIRRIDHQPSKLIHLTDVPKGLKGEIVAIGPGKWIAGTWWKSGGEWLADENGIRHKSGGEWIWIPGHHEEHPLKPGMKVLFNSKWNDFSSADFHHVLPVGIPDNLHLVQVADVYCILGDDVTSAVSGERQATDIVPPLQYQAPPKING